LLILLQRFLGGFALGDVPRDGHDQRLSGHLHRRHGHFSDDDLTVSSFVSPFEAMAPVANRGFHHFHRFRHGALSIRL
jgi:hypothetical protein